MVKDEQRTVSAISALQQKIEAILLDLDGATDADLHGIENCIGTICSSIDGADNLTSERKRELLVGIEASVGALDRLAGAIRDRRRAAPAAE